MTSLVLDNDKAMLLLDLVWALPLDFVDLDNIYVLLVMDLFVPG